MVVETGTGAGTVCSPAETGGAVTGADDEGTGLAAFALPRESSSFVPRGKVGGKSSDVLERAAGGRDF